MIYRSPEVLPMWLLENTDMKLCLSFLCFTQEGTPLGHQGDPVLPSVSPLKIFGPDKTLTCYSLYDCTDLEESNEDSYA